MFLLGMQREIASLQELLQWGLRIEEKQTYMHMEGMRADKATPDMGRVERGGKTYKKSEGLAECPVFVDELRQAIYLSELLRCESRAGGGWQSVLPV